MRVSKKSTFLSVIFTLATFVTFLNSSILQGQDIGVEYGSTLAGYENALERPKGLGVHADIPLLNNIALPVIEGIDLRLRASKHTEHLTITGSRCTGLVQPGSDCSTDTFDSDSRFTQFGAGFVIGFESFIAGLRPEVYAMGINTNVAADFVGRESGKNIGPITPKNKSMGIEFGGMLNYSISPFIDLYGRLAIQNTNIQTCGEDGWFAFCENKKVLQFSFGTQLRFSALR